MSIDLLKAHLEFSKGVVKTERETPVEEEIDHRKAALIELFEEARNGDTPLMVQRIVDDIDEIVRKVRFDGWQATHVGEREVSRKHCGRRCSNTSYTRIPSCSGARTGIFGSTTGGLSIPQLLTFRRCYSPRIEGD